MAASTHNPEAPASSGTFKNVVKDSQGRTHGATPASSGIGSSSKLSTAEGLATEVLQFLSTASSEVLCGIALGLIVCTYLVLGRIGLVLIGALGGIVLHATWECQGAPIGRVEVAQKELGLDVVRRVLKWREDRGESHDNKEMDQFEESKLTVMGLDDFLPETSAALTGFVDAIIRDYVKWWYSPIIPADESFPTACKDVLTSFLHSVSTNLARKRPADTFVDFLTNSSSILILFLGELSSALSAAQGSTLTPAEAVDEYLLANPESNLANIINEKQQKKKFKMIAEDILESFLEKTTFDCLPTRVFLREMLANMVMEMSLKLFSKAEWINGWIVYLLEAGEPELSQVIDAGVSRTSSNDIEANLGNNRSAKFNPGEEKKHQKRLSKAEEALEEGVEEARRLSRLIAEEGNQRLRIQEASCNEREEKSINTSLEMRMSEELLHSALPDVDKRESDITETTVNVRLDPSSPKIPTDSKGTVFTSFDQIVPLSQLTVLQPAETQVSRGSLRPTLHNAKISIDNSMASDEGHIRPRPMDEYLVQIEPKLSTGWIVMRKYYDFETLHEILLRIANVSDAKAFNEKHSVLPDWKTQTKSSLRDELERYLRDACWYKSLAESEGMRRFLERDQANTQSSSSKGIGWPTPATFESMGKGMLDVLASAPKGAAEGGKAVFGGVTGVLGNIGSLGQKKRENVNGIRTHATLSSSTSTLPRLDDPYSTIGPLLGMDSEESLKASSPIVQTQPARIPSMERRLSYMSTAENRTETELEATERGWLSLSSRSSTSDPISASNAGDPSRTPSTTAQASFSTEIFDIENIILPPLPSDIPDDYGSQKVSSSLSHSRTQSIAATSRTSISTAPSLQSPSRTSISAPIRPPLSKRFRKEATPLTEEETRVAVELLFAVINELYTLSSVWNIRRTLLNAAKTYLLRPGNPSLASIQFLLQDSVIASNTTDSSIAAHIRKLRENTMPTEEELKAWPPDMTADEKEKLRLKARKLFVEKGMPAALTRVMGQAATVEAMGKVFDYLQAEKIARGLIFGILIQGVTAVTQ